MHTSLSAAAISESNRNRVGSAIALTLRANSVASRALSGARISGTQHNTAEVDVATMARSVTRSVWRTY